jgi:hypothetical protein
MEEDNEGRGRWPGQHMTLGNRVSVRVRNRVSVRVKTPDKYKIVFPHNIVNLNNKSLNINNKVKKLNNYANKKYHN